MFRQGLNPNLYRPDRFEISFDEKSLLAELIFNRNYHSGLSIQV
jgi:hypothetical protein